ncbi:MAG: His/Gly/Thr/Pro-type tRNA ligase C-terminal domain-containing protein, partial [Candidatus Marinimicrobia bacterium]|nr:His/Gly/Thr/Pro-type tRNA ligase C-terminal domain-containing protein [Candidatus Neomarinimicrobiota bacterium]
LSLDDYEVAIRFTRDFYEENRDFIVGLVKIVNKPVLIELWDQRFFYFVLKFEFNYIDAMNKASALSTVQIDVENAERYGIKYIDSDGTEKRPFILHCSPSGAIERCIYALLEKASMNSEKGIVPMLPVWLSPTQVRVIPVTDKHMEYAQKVAAELNGRVDIDDREETVGKKIRDAAKEWIPYIAVVGDEEIESCGITVTVRSESQPNKPLNVKMTVQELNERVSKDIAGYPFKRHPLSINLSARPRFV